MPIAVPTSRGSSPRCTPSCTHPRGPSGHCLLGTLPCGFYHRSCSRSFPSSFLRSCRFLLLPILSLLLSHWSCCCLSRCCCWCCQGKLSRCRVKVGVSKVTWWAILWFCEFCPSLVNHTAVVLFEQELVLEKQFEAHKKSKQPQVHL